MNFQDRLYRLRKERGISQEELANAVGVSRQAVQKWESGASAPDVGNLVALSDFFGTTLDYLLKGLEPAPAEPPADGAGQFYPPLRFEYKSRRTLFGLPLVHVNVGRFCMPRARGILAVGNVATGVFSLGFASAGLFSLGGASLGLFSLGGLALGLLAVGGLSLGGIALGGLAVGWLAAGGCAIGVYAMGGAAVAGRIAAGGAASGFLAIGDAVKGTVTFPVHGAPPADVDALRATIGQYYPHLPRWLANLFCAMV